MGSSVLPYSRLSPLSPDLPGSAGIKSVDLGDDQGGRLGGLLDSSNAKEVSEQRNFEQL